MHPFCTPWKHFQGVQKGCILNEWVKLGSMKLFVQALNKNGDCFQHICKSFPCVSMEQLENGTFNAPQIKKLMKDENFSVSMNLDELDAWFAFVEIVENSFGNHEAENTRNSFITC